MQDSNVGGINNSTKHNTETSMPDYKNEVAGLLNKITTRPAKTETKISLSENAFDYLSTTGKHTDGGRVC